MRTYDIVNAGPRNRFMAAGVIVSNSSRGIQLQNLPAARVMIDPKKVKEAIRAIKEGFPLELINEFFGPPLVVASELLRPIFIGSDGHWIARGDYSQIEARSLAYLAGEEKILKAFRDYDAGIGPDLYIIAASDIYGVPPSEIGKKDPRRQVGKVVVLACVAEGSPVLTDRGLVAIQDVTPDMKVWDGLEWVSHDGAIYKGVKPCIEYDGVTATPDHQVFVDSLLRPATMQEALDNGLSLRRGAKTDDPKAVRRRRTPSRKRVWDLINAGPRNRFTVSGRLVHNCGYQGSVGAFQAMARVYKVHVSDEKAAEATKAWRARNPNIVKFWKDLETAALACMRAPIGEVFPVGRHVTFRRTTRCLAMKLSSGSTIFYWFPRIEKVKMPWNDQNGQPVLKDGITYMGRHPKTKKWWRLKALYGGILAENATQRFARDIMADALIRLEKAGMQPVLTVHDEALCQLPKSKYPTEESAKEAIEEIMRVVPVWARGLPIAADASADERYIKKD